MNTVPEIRILMNKSLFTVILFAISVIILHGAESTNINPPELTIKMITPGVDATREDPAWRHAEEINNLVNVLNPEPEQPAPQPTKTRLLWDDK